MGEPIPSASNDAEDTSKPTNAEDRKAAAALDSLNANAMSQENGEGSGTKQPTAADQEALGKAMARLEGVAGGKSGSKKVESKGDGKGAVKRKEEEIKKKVKVDAGDVQFLVSPLLGTWLGVLIQRRAVYCFVEADVSLWYGVRVSPLQEEVA